MSTPAFDLVLRGGSVVKMDAVVTADVAVADGTIVAVGEVSGDGRETFDATGLHLFPGVIDAHVHFNEPGRTEWEGWRSGSRALAAGGGVLAIDMPLNASPPTTNAAAFDAKRAAADASSLVDFALWGGIVPGNLHELDELAARGVVGFKAFMLPTGTDDFPAADDLTLFEGMRAAARLGLPVAVHAESGVVCAGLTARAVAEGRLGALDYARSRPALAETEAIVRALHLAAEAGGALHVVHVSTGRGMALIAEARARGQAVTSETCPHYLTFTEEDLERVGAALKCAPPLRPAAERDALWQAVATGQVDIVASDHSPAPPTLKGGDDFHRVWGGISGVQSTLPVLLSEGYAARAIDLPLLSRLVSTNVARRFRLPNKGAIAPGMDADVAIYDLGAEWALERGDLQDRHAANPYLESRFRGKPRATLVRGAFVWRDGAVVAPPRGQFVRPSA